MDSTAPATSAAPEAAPTGAPATETPAQTAARLYKVTVNGAEREVGEEDLIRGYQKGLSADEKFQQANEQYKIAEEVLRLFKTSPKEAMAKLGMDAKQFAEQVLQEHMEELQLTDEQRELRDAKRRLDEYQKREAAEKAEQSRREVEAFQTQFDQQIQTDIMGALDSAGLPKNEYTVGRFAYWMDVALNQRGTYVPAQEVVHLVNQEYQQDLKAMLGALPEDKLLAFLGDDLSKKALKASAKKYKSEQTTVPPVRRQQKEEAGRPKTALELRAERRRLM